MNSILTIAIAGAAMLGAASCSTSRQAATVADLTGEWNLLDVNGEAIPTHEGEDLPYIAFDTANGRVSGSTGCNRLMGSFDPAAAPGTIDLSAMGSTRMACPDMSTEQAFLEALGKAKGYRLNAAGDLELTAPEGKPVLTFTRRVPEFSAASLAGEWKIEEVDSLDLSADTTGEYAIMFTPSDSTFAASTGCNNISGRYNAAYVDIKFTTMGSTRMACPDMSVEQAMTRVLPTVSWFGELASGNVGFYTPANDLVMVISRKAE